MRGEEYAYQARGRHWCVLTTVDKLRMRDVSAVGSCRDSSWTLSSARITRDRKPGASTPSLRLNCGLVTIASRGLDGRAALSSRSIVRGVGVAFC